MPAAPKDTIKVTDSTLSTTVRMPPIDALEVTKKFPSRYSLAEADPRSVVLTIADHFLTGADLAKPTVTGSKGGNAALTSLVSALVSLGLIIDQTS